jgi:lysophospholipase L1-like esterase
LRTKRGSGSARSVWSTVRNWDWSLFTYLLLIDRGWNPCNRLTHCEHFHGQIPGVIEERASAGKHVLMADLNTDYDTDNFSDVVHPDKAGYDFMAEKWYEVIKEYLPDAP